ncbi:hypothetical protein R1sor_016063 [Riccia sorocarpa]|uniref:VOC domain-containing protein n=1 Tax=Riccia sorocarpa TaxID=122646 RepID=A0ABD3HHZ0_9MARC
MALLAISSSFILHPSHPLNSVGKTSISSKKLIYNRSLGRTFALVKQEQRRVQCRASSSTQQENETETKTVHGEKLDFTGMHHVGLLCENLERSMKFYQEILGLELNPDRPADKLPYRGAWFWIGDEMIHLMELPNPDPVTGRPEHGGRDRHACVAIRNVEPLKRALEKAGVPYTMSKSGRPALFARDPDGNALEFTQVD